jgi:hypothetical protein
MVILAIESRRDVKAVTCEHLGEPIQGLTVSYTQGNVVRDSGAGVTRPVCRRAEKINGDWSVRGSIEKAEHSAFSTELRKTQSLRQKFRRMLKTFDLNLDRTNPSD